MQGRVVTPRLRVKPLSLSLPVATVGIIAAMPQEFGRIAELFACKNTELIGPRTFYSGEFGGTELVLVVSHIGKVAAATTSTLLIDRFGVDAVVCVGVAGGVGEGIGIGDFVLAEHLVQHDIDCKGVLGFDRHVVPSLGVAKLPTASSLTEAAQSAAQVVVASSEYRAAVLDLAQRNPSLRYGVIATGDQFINDIGERQQLAARIPDLLAVEMEGAAIGQVCAERGVPCVVARVISDTASGDAASDFGAFVERAAAVASAQFVREFVERMAL